MEHELYKEHILEHYRNPRNKRVLNNATVVCREVNMLCGDDVTLYCACDGNGVITNMTFTGDGCAISQAAASLLTDVVIGKQTRDIAEYTLRDMETLLGISLSPPRARCALLPILAFRGLGRPVSK